MSDEPIVFTIEKENGYYCRITVRHIRQEIRDILGNGLICNLKDLLAEMERISSIVNNEFKRACLFEIV